MPCKEDPKAININFNYFVSIGKKGQNVCKTFISLRGITDKQVHRLCVLLVGCEIPRDKGGTNAKANAVPGYVCKKSPRKATHYWGKVLTCLSGRLM
jgi:hypothetical protein